MGVKHAMHGERILCAGAGQDADENSAKTQTRYALLGLALRYRRFASPGGAGRRFYSGEVLGRSGSSRGAVRAPVVVRHRDHGRQGWDVPCVVAIDSAGRIYVAFKLRGLRHEEKQRRGGFQPGRREAACQDNKRASWPLRLIKAWGRRLPFRQLACQVAWGPFEVGRRGRVPGCSALHLVSSTVSLAASRPDENPDTMPKHKPHRTTVSL
jgi:hypothetical protein